MNSSSRTCPVVIFLGLQDLINKKAQGQSSAADVVWKGFNFNRSSSRINLTYKNELINHTFPPVKAPSSASKRNSSSEIIKPAWTEKHSTSIPSVLVVFFELEWDDANWEARKITCGKHLREIRKNISGRNARVVVVLIQRSAIPKDESITEIHAIEFRKHCEVEGKNSLFILPVSDKESELHVYINRLENVFQELAQEFYDENIRKVKGKLVHAQMDPKRLIRYSFKLAFYYEMNDEKSESLRYYDQAYANLFNYKERDQTELQTVAGFITYKACWLQFRVAPGNAIVQFRRHIAHFKQPPSHVKSQPELEFKHLSWVTKEYERFAKLFEDSIELNLVSAHISQHPGYAYHQAVNYAILGLRCLEKIPKDTKIPLLRRLSDDLIKVEESVEADNSLFVIDLLTKARNHFKKFKCLRMTQLLSVKISLEYMLNGRLDNALAIYDTVDRNYRKENWVQLVEGIAENIFWCSYCLLKTQFTLQYALECSIKSFKPTVRLPLSYQDVLLQMIENGKVKCMERVDAKTIKLSESSDEKSFEPSWVDFNMANLSPVVTMHVRFHEEVVSPDCPIIFELLVVSHFSDPIDFDSLKIEFNDLVQDISCTLSPQAENNDCVEFSAKELTDKNGNVNCDLNFGVLQERKFLFTITPNVNADVLLECKKIILSKGTGAMGVNLIWDSVSLKSPSYARQYTDQYHKDFTYMNDFNERWATRLAPRRANISLKAKDSTHSLDTKDAVHGIVGQNCPFSLTLESQEDMLLENVTVTLSVSQSESLTSAPSLSDSLMEDEIETVIDPGEQPHITLIDGVLLQSTTLPSGIIQHQFSLADVNSNGIVHLSCLISNCLKPGQYFLTARLDYVVEVGSKVSCYKQNVFSVGITEPFRWTVTPNDKNFKLIHDVIEIENPFLILSHIACTAPYPLQIESIKFQLDESVEAVEDMAIKEGLVLKPGDVYSDCVGLKCKTPNLHSLKIGQCLVTWKSLDIQENHGVSYFDLPIVNTKTNPFTVSSRIPPFGTVDNLIPISFTVENNTDSVHRITFALDSSDSFMFSGYKSCSVRIFPNCTHTQAYNLFPLDSGKLLLPKLDIIQMTTQTPIEFDSSMYIFVKPESA